MKITSIYFTHFEKLILNSIDISGYDNIDENCILGILNKVYSIFQSEYVYKNNRHLGDQKLFSEWLQGLPSVLTPPFYNYDILQGAILVGHDVSTEEKEDIYLQNYWDNLATAFFRLKENM